VNGPRQAIDIIQVWQLARAGGAFILVDDLLVSHCRNGQRRKISKYQLGENSRIIKSQEIGNKRLVPFGSIEFKYSNYNEIIVMQSAIPSARLSPRESKQ
jgi:hypothetical protein